jgi:hypothetical protein
MEGASGVLQTVSYKRKISSINNPSLGIQAPNAVDDTGSAGAEPAAAGASQAEPEAEAWSEVAAPAKPGRAAGVSCARLVAAANSQLSGGPAGRMQQITNHLIKV